MEPTAGLEQMRARRGPEKREVDLCSGPGKLGKAIGLGAPDHGTSIIGTDGRGIQPMPGGEKRPEILSDVRVGITKAVGLPWRFLVVDNPHVSVAAGKVKKVQR